MSSRRRRCQFCGAFSCSRFHGCLLRSVAFLWEAARQLPRRLLLVRASVLDRLLAPIWICYGSAPSSEEVDATAMKKQPTNIIMIKNKNRRIPA